MSQINAIFFDLDDTLVNSNKAEHDASIEFKRNFQEFNKMDDEYFAELWHKIASKQYERYSRKEISYEINKINRIKEMFSSINIQKEDNEAAKIFCIYLKLYEKNWKLFKDAKETLDILKSKYKIGIITNGDGNQQRKKIQLTGLENYFSELIISSEVNASKPNKEIFKIACKKIKENPENCIMVGDNFKLDIQGAINCGLNAIWVNRKNEDIKYENQIKELKELISTL
ncbi:MAG: HAD family hydrolase [Clostridia bacterium]|nr:HAD family hydrolase [Clostridia bacterium]